MSRNSVYLRRSRYAGLACLATAVALLVSAVPSASAFSGERLVRSNAWPLSVSADGTKALVFDDEDGLMLVETKVGGRATPVAHGDPYAKLTGDGKRLIFTTERPLVANDRNNANDVYSYELATKAYRLLTGRFALRPQGWEIGLVLSVDADGSRIAFHSGNSNLALVRVAIWDVPTATVRFPDSRLGAAAAPRSQSNQIWLSADGSVAVWKSFSTAGAWPTMYRYSWTTNSARTVSKTAAGKLIPGGVRGGAISPDGRFALFAAAGAGIAGSGTPAGDALYRVDMTLNRTVRVADRISTEDKAAMSIGLGGKYVAYQRVLTLQWGCCERLAFVKNMVTGAVLDLGQPNAPAKANGHSFGVVLAGNGRVVLFHSLARNFGVTVPPGGLGATFLANLPA